MNQTLKPILLALAGSLAALASPISVDSRYSLSLITNGLGITSSGVALIPSTGRVDVNTNASIIDSVNPANGSFTTLSLYGYSLAGDSSGNIYLTETASGAQYGTKKYDSSGNFQTFYNTGNGTDIITVDSAGNLYAAKYDGQYNTTILKFAAGSTTSTTYASGLYYVRGLAVDDSGQVYAQSAGQVYKVAAGGTTQGSHTLLATGLNGTRGLIWNSATGLLDINGGYELDQIHADGTWSQVATGFTFALGATVNAAGDIFISDQVGGLGAQTGGALYELTPTSSSSSGTPEPASGLLVGIGMVAAVVARHRRLAGSRP